MTRYFKPILIVLLALIALINGVYVYGMYIYSHTPCLADGLLVFDSSQRTPPKWLSNAQEDINLLMASKNPKYVKLVDCVPDGGSCFYKADKYSLAIWHSLARVENIHGHVRGFTLDPGDGGKPLSHTWFSPDENRGE